MITVQPAAGHEIEIALKFLTQRLPAEEQREQIAGALQSARCGELCLDGLLLARRNGRPAGAMLTILQTGGTASLWPPEIAVDEDEDVAGILLRTGIDRLSSADVSIIQSIVECEEIQGREILNQNGLPHLTDLVFMERDLRPAPLPTAESQMDYVTYHERTHSRFVELLRQSYRETFDCPELDGARTAEQALQGHRATGRFQPEYWRLFLLDDKDAGVLLISEHPDQHAWELAYMGVVPPARGQGLAGRMLTATLPDLPGEHSQTIFLAVDIRNRYALATYERQGFTVLAKRALHLRLPEGARGSGN